MLRRSKLLPLVVVVACSGSGVSTTARTTTDSASVGTDASSVTDASAEDDGEEEDDTDPSDADTDPSASDDDTDDEGETSDSSASAGTDDPTAEEDSGDTTPEEVTFEGSWLSEGDNVAPLLVDLTGAVSIYATFGPQAFTVDTTDDQGQMVQQLGVYTATPSGVGDIYEITLEQTMPQAITVEGIFEIDDSVSPAILRYEVVQTEPSVGATAPTAEGGFGSTSLGSDLTQVYVRQ